MPEFLLWDQWSLILYLFYSGVKTWIPHRILNLRKGWYMFKMYFLGLLSYGLLAFKKSPNCSNSALCNSHFGDHLGQSPGPLFSPSPPLVHPYSLVRAFITRLPPQFDESSLWGGWGRFGWERTRLFRGKLHLVHFCPIKIPRKRSNSSDCFRIHIKFPSCLISWSL